MKRQKYKLICGWGVNDVDYAVYKYEVLGGVHRRVWTCPYYTDWLNMIYRCYNTKTHKIYPTYKNCTICEDWKYLSNFIKWVDSQPNKDWENCEPDKDFLIEGNKHYSADTVVYIPKKLNSFIINCGKARGKHMVGVKPCKTSRINPYESTCSDPFTGKIMYLGIYPTELEAHLAWKAKKHEHACALANLQEDERIAKRLREMYAPDTDWTNI